MFCVASRLLHGSKEHQERFALVLIYIDAAAAAVGISLGCIYVGVDSIGVYYAVYALHYFGGISRITLEIRVLGREAREAWFSVFKHHQERYSTPGGF